MLKLRPRLTCVSWRRAALLALTLALFTAAMPGAAGAAVLHDQTDSPSGLADPSSDFLTINDNSDSQIADDFTVPAGQSWQISQVDVIGVNSGVPPSAVNVFLYSNAGTLPGAELFNETGITSSGPSYSIPITGAPSLTSGTYWVSVQQAGADFEACTGVPEVCAGGYWTWTDRTVQSGNPAAFREGGGWSTSCTASWGARMTCIGGPDPDQLFKLTGTLTQGPPPPPPPPPPSNSFTIGEVSGKKVSLTVPGAGGIDVNDANASKRKPLLKPSSATASGAGTVEVALKLTKAAKKKLKQKDRVKVNAAITFTPTGGTANTQDKALKVKK
jgi:hypothetical protein